MSKLNLYRMEKDQLREDLLKYTRKAYKLIPSIKNPNILDVGCGTGVPTIELAKISKGHITGIDIDETSLDLLKINIKDAGLNNRISVIKGSILTMDFPEESFDIIWAEGSVFVIGFEESIDKWRRFIKPNGFLVIHDEIKDQTKKLGLISKYGYLLIAQFELTDTIWWREYFTPLEQLVQKYRGMYPNDSEIRSEIEKDQNEINMCKSNPELANSFYAIIKKV